MKRTRFFAQSVGPQGIMELRNDPHKSAALVYAGLGAIVIMITLLARLVPAGRENAVLELGIGLVFLIIFAALIYRGFWPASALLVFSNSWRVFTYFNDGRGVHVEILPFSVTQIQARPVAFVNAALMLVIVFMLARSAWFGFRNWRKQRRDSNRGDSNRGDSNHGDNGREEQSS